MTESFVPRSEVNKYGAIVVACLCWSLYACSEPPISNPPPQEASQRTQPEYVGKVWMATDPSAAPGGLRIFLPDGTLVMDSCGETYRLARWRAIDERRIEWQEDSARIEADVTHVTSDQLQLRLHLVREVKEENYRLAQVPFVCPDARPNQATSAIHVEGTLLFSSVWRSHPRPWSASSCATRHART